MEAVGRTGGGDDRDGRLPVPAEHRLQQVSLLGLGRHPGGRAGPLDVADDQRQLDRYGQADGLGLQQNARSGGGGDAQRAAERSAERRADRGDLVLGLERADPETLVLGQLVQDVRGRRDRVGAEEQRQAGQLRGGDEPVGQGRVADDVPVGARRQRRGLDLVPDRERLGGLAEVPARLEGGHVGLHDLGLAGELGLEVAQRAVRGPSSR